MSVHRRNGKWQVKWREGERQRSRTFTRKGDADTFDREIERRRQLGPALVRELTRDALTLDGFVRAGFRAHAVTLSLKTRSQYAWALEHHLAELVDEPLIALDVPRLAAHQQFLLVNGRSANTVREAMTRLSGILQVAVEHGHLLGNPVRGMRKVQAEPREEVRPLAPAELEAVLLAFDGRSRIIALLGGHAGLRPMEIRMAPWRNLDGDRLTIGRAQTKRAAARSRVITLPAVAVAELRRWRLASGRPSDDQPIVGPMSKSALTQWGWKTLRPTVKRVVGRDDVTLYTLRHSHASALHYCGYTVPAAARRLGHSGQVHLGYYAHVIDALEGQAKHADLDALIAEARAPRAVKRAGLAFPTGSPSSP